MRARTDLRAALDEEARRSDRLSDAVEGLRDENARLRADLSAAEDRLRGNAITMAKAARHVRGLTRQLQEARSTLDSVLGYQGEARR